jgi:class 3 adenylate cyclase
VGLTTLVIFSSAEDAFNDLRIFRRKIRQDTAPFFDGERERAAILFSDLSGYTAVSEKLNSEDIGSIMNEVFDCIRQVVSKYDRFLDKFIGDAVQGISGIPKAHQDDAVRAIRRMEIHCQVETLSIRHLEKFGSRAQQGTSYI